MSCLSASVPLYFSGTVAEYNPSSRELLGLLGVSSIVQKSSSFDMAPWLLDTKSNKDQCLGNAIRREVKKIEQSFGPP